MERTKAGGAGAAANCGSSHGPGFRFEAIEAGVEFNDGGALIEVVALVGGCPGEGHGWFHALGRISAQPPSRTVTSRDVRGSVGRDSSSSRVTSVCCFSTNQS
jgi:hypothetical protein